MFKTITKTTILAAAIATVATGAVAKDWMEKVEVKRDGIEVVPIEVTANSYNYDNIKTKSHRFLLHLYGKATNGERIVAMKVGSFKGVRYFEADGSLWSKSFQHRDVGSDSKRSVAITYKPVIPLKIVKCRAGTRSRPAPPISTRRSRRA